MLYKFTKNQQSGFTLMEVLVSVGIFIIVVAGLLGMFTQTIQINRRVQTIRELVQGTRAFTEIVTREVRNGRIDYDGGDVNCTGSYGGIQNKALALIRGNGDRICFYLDDNGGFYLKKQGAGNPELVFNSTRFKINPDSFYFHVFPTEDPSPACAEDPGGCPFQLPEMQPFVTVVAQFELDHDSNPATSLDYAKIDYQTTISTDVYDIPKDE